MQLKHQNIRTMRKRFEAQIKIGSTPISEVKITTKSRDEMPPLMRALKEIYINAELSQEIYSIIEDKICKGKKKTGRNGEPLEHIRTGAIALMLEYQL